MSESDVPPNLKLERRSLRVWLGVPLGLAVVGVAVWALTAYARAPILAAWLAIAAVGWILYRFGRASIVAVILWIAAAAMLGIGIWTPTSCGEPWVGIAQLEETAGFLLFLAAGVTFLMASLKNRTRCAGNCAGCMIVFFSVLVTAMSAHAIHSRREMAGAVQETRQLLLTLHRLSAEIEAIRAKTGRLPKDEAELVTLRGKPMPPYYRQYQVRYYRNEMGGYSMHCSAPDFWGEHWDLFGWIILFYGPNSTQRLEVDLF